MKVLRTYSLITILIVTSMLSLSGGELLQGKESNPVEEITSDTRSMGETIYLQKTFWIPDSYDEESLWVLASFENSERYDVEGSDEETYSGHTIDNTFTFPLDGTSHSSGEEKRTIFELFTSTNCPACPGPEGATGRMVDDDTMPEECSIVHWHFANDDPYRSNSGGGRLSFYGVTATPTMIIDGDIVLVGGDMSPENKDFDRTYDTAINYTSGEPFGSVLEGRASITPSPTGGSDVTINVSATQIGPLERGSWNLRAILCEDIDKAVENHRIRMVGRKSISTGTLFDFQDEDPTIDIDNEATFSPFEDGPARENITVQWSASDPEDGEDITVDIYYWAGWEGMKLISSGEDNDGSFNWNTMDPRIPDGEYSIRLVATDSEGNSVEEHSRLFEIDNRDPPEINLTQPAECESISGSYFIKWESSDDEDPNKEDLLCKVSISNDTGETWRVLTYDFQTGGDYVINQDQYRLNTLNYEDRSTYMIKIELLDTHGLRTVETTGVFEIYNNDQPTAYLLSPGIDETVSETLDIGWRVEDQEDTPDDTRGNFTVTKESDGSSLTIYDGYLDDEMGNKTFPTSALFGDGGYTLTFTVNDSRGKKDSVEVPFRVYDPDAPVINSLMGPEDGVKDQLMINWSAEDPDGEELTYSLYLREEKEEDWSLVADGLKNSEYTVDASSMNQTNWYARVVVVDSSPFSLSDESVYGPFYLEVEERPILNLISPATDFSGTMGTDDYNDTSAMEPYLISWDASDPDGDALSYYIHYRDQYEEEWIEIAGGLEETEYYWNFSMIEEGSYLLRVQVIDNSSERLSRSVTVGPFEIKQPDMQPVEEDDDEPGKDTNAEEGPDILLFAGIGVGALVVVIILMVIIMVLMSRSKKKKALPDNVDLSVPEFEDSVPDSVDRTEPEPLQTPPTSPRELNRDQNR